jgi:hypothetical protein
MSPTPILDRQQPPPAPKKPRKWITTMVGGAIGVAIVFLGPKFLPDNLALALPLFFPALFVGVLLHELGHVAAGLLAGLQFRHVLVGPWALTRSARGFRLQFHWRRLLAGGLTLMVPRSPDGIRSEFRLFVAGGPVVTLLVFGAVALLPWGPVSAALLEANLLIAASCLIPMEVRGYYTDAKHIAILGGDGPEGDRLAAILYLMMLDGQGVRPRAWPAEVVANLALPGGRAYRGGGRIYLHIYARDTSPQAEVAAALEQVLAVSNELNAALRLTYFSEAAFFQSANNRNAALAHAWLADARAVQGAVAQKGWDEPALTAIAYAEGNDAELRQHHQRALEYLDGLPGPTGSGIAYRERLEELAATAPVPSTHPPAR